MKRNKDVYNLAKVGMVYLNDDKIEFVDEHEVIFVADTNDMQRATIQFYKWLEEEFNSLTYAEKRTLAFMNPEAWLAKDSDGQTFITLDEPIYTDDDESYTPVGDYEVMEEPFEGVKECTQIKKLLCK